MNALTGTGRLLRLALRRDRVVLGAWILGLTVFLLGTTHMSVVGLPTHHDVVTRDPVHGRQPGHAPDEPVGGGQRRRLRHEPQLPDASRSWPP